MHLLSLQEISQKLPHDNSSLIVLAARDSGKCSLPSSNGNNHGRGAKWIITLALSFLLTQQFLY